MELIDLVFCEPMYFIFEQAVLKPDCLLWIQFFNEFFTQCNCSTLWIIVQILINLKFDTFFYFTTFVVILSPWAFIFHSFYSYNIRQYVENNQLRLIYFKYMQFYFLMKTVNS